MPTTAVPHVSLFVGVGLKPTLAVRQTILPMADTAES